MPDNLPRRLIGTSEIWNDDGTGYRAFFILFIRVWTEKFYHSTTFLD